MIGHQLPNTNESATVAKFQIFFAFKHPLGKIFQCVAYVYPWKCHRYDLLSFRNQNFTLFSDLQAVTTENMWW